MYGRVDIGLGSAIEWIRSQRKVRLRAVLGSVRGHLMSISSPDLPDLA